MTINWINWSLIPIISKEAKKRNAIAPVRYQRVLMKFRTAKARTTATKIVANANVIVFSPVSAFITAQRSSNDVRGSYQK